MKVGLVIDNTDANFGRSPVSRLTAPGVLVENFIAATYMIRGMLILIIASFGLIQSTSYCNLCFGEMFINLESDLLVMWLDSARASEL